MWVGRRMRPEWPLDGASSNRTMASFFHPTRYDQRKWKKITFCPISWQVVHSQIILREAHLIYRFIGDELLEKKMHTFDTSSLSFLLN